jgi:hypothetical protein
MDLDLLNNIIESYKTFQLSADAPKKLRWKILQPG